MPMASFAVSRCGPRGPRLGFRQAADRRVHRVLARRRLRDLRPLQGEPPRAGGHFHPGVRLYDVRRIHGSDEAEAAGATRGVQAPRTLAVRFAVRGSQGAFVALPAVFLLVLEPREEAGRGAERPELEDHLAVLLVLRLQEYPPAFGDHIDRLLERNLVEPFPFLAARQIKPVGIEEEEAPSGLPHPSLPRVHERLLRHGDRLIDFILELAIPDDLVAAGEDRLVRLREDDADLADLVDLHSVDANLSRGISLPSESGDHSENSSRPIDGLISPATFVAIARATSAGSRVCPSTHISLTYAVSGLMSSPPMTPALIRSRPVSYTRMFTRPWRVCVVMTIATPSLAKRCTTGTRSSETWPRPVPAMTAPWTS